MGTFALVDADTSTSLSYQKDARTTEILFVAPDMPPLGLKRFDIMPGQPPPSPFSALVTGPGFVESQHFRVDLDANGYVAGILDKRNSRQLVSPTSAFDFNRIVTATNSDYFFGTVKPVADATAPVIAPAMNGPVAASLRVVNGAHPLAASEIILYDSLDRIDFVNTPDRDQMAYAPHSVNSLLYGFTFPLNLSGYTPRVDTAAGWLNPVTESLSGSYTGAYAVQHGVDLSEPGYGVTFAAPDVFVHSFGAYQCYSYPPAEPTIVSTFVRYQDECLLQGGATGSVVVEPGAAPQWDLRYSMRPHLRGFDAVADARFGWESGTPLMARHLPVGAAGPLNAARLGFFTVSAPGVVVTSIKKADFGTGIIVKLQEVGRTAVPSATLTSGYFGVTGAWNSTPLEEDIAPVPVTGGNSIELSFAPAEIKTLRLAISDPSGVGEWALY